MIGNALKKEDGDEGSDGCADSTGKGVGSSSLLLRSPPHSAPLRRSAGQEHVVVAKYLAQFVLRKDPRGVFVAGVGVMMK